MGCPLRGPYSCRPKEPHLMLVLADFPYWATAIIAALFLFVCVLLILAVLIQRPAGGGLSGAFGSGAGSGQTAFGAKTGDALTIATITIFVVYILFAVFLNYAARPQVIAPTPPAANGTGGTAPPTGTTQSGEVPAAPTGAQAPTGATGPTGANGATAATGSPTAAPTGTPPATGQPAPTGSPAATGSPAPTGTP